MVDSVRKKTHSLCSVGNVPGYFIDFMTMFENQREEFAIYKLQVCNMSDSTGYNSQSVAFNVRLEVPFFAIELCRACLEPSTKRYCCTQYHKPMNLNQAHCAYAGSPKKTFKTLPAQTTPYAIVC